MVSVDIYEQQIDDHLVMIEKCRDLLPLVGELIDACNKAFRAGNKLMLCGNGGSAADSQHIATELTVRFETERKGLPAIALTTDTSALTAAGNDFGFERIFSRQVEALGRSGDILIGLSTSGTSPNIMAAFDEARQGGIATWCLTGRDGGISDAHSDHQIIVPSDNTARIQEAHIMIGHMLCHGIDHGH